MVGVRAKQVTECSKKCSLAYPPLAAQHNGYLGREIRQLLERLYPPMLKEAGIGGRVLLWVFVDETGRAARSQIHTSSGYPALDNAAAQIVEQMEFSPAMNRDKPVGVWIAQPIDFSGTG